ncbi:hypothetical protein K435DRAFT_865579 [Dendrothele bispora CBS 962.96]|uniref:Uncharacterized protein n=1 Tax=Dendrothele bispora (strain CBS 962.96) TaxID=1314807 RepID=A0A4V4HE16_DENBC|nr:hypothetical protein K435DRAFT_865579 [Dendrothele bispora CBS 962.96]
MTRRQVQGQFTVSKDLPPLPTPRTDPRDSNQTKSSANATQESRPSSQISQESETLHSTSSSSLRQNGTFIRSRISRNDMSLHQRTSHNSIQFSIDFPSQAPDTHTKERTPTEISEVAKRRIRSDSDAQSVFTKSFKSNRTATSNSSAKSGCSSMSLLRVVRKNRETESTIDEDDEELDEATREARVVTRLVAKKWRYESQG